MAAVAQLRFSPHSNPNDLAGNSQFSTRTSSRLPSLPISSPFNISLNSRSPVNLSLSLLQSKSSKTKFSFWLVLNSWISRIAVDPQFSFKVSMEEIVRVSACVLGDMAFCPTFGLNELDFVFSTLVVGSILNSFSCICYPQQWVQHLHLFLPSFQAVQRSICLNPRCLLLSIDLGLLFTKELFLLRLGFAAGLVETAILNGLILTRKKMNPNLDTPNKPKYTLFNAMIWATHMGLSSNFRYQTLNEIEFLLAKGLPLVVFKGSVVILRLTRSQKVEEKPVLSIKEGVGEET
ncbi:hypothetical protein MKW92_044186 [Papaver armeniacum]|nr:hypothetical protein MKW92_044186 [Papaver armeniacum]